MNIDWFTFTAQVINFLVLIVLLRWFLYGPIVKAIKDREDKIAQRIVQADEKQQQADLQAEQYRRQRQDLDAQQDALIVQAKQHAEKFKKELTQQAREEVDRQRDEWTNAVKRHREMIVNSILERSAKQVLAATRRTLAELADVELEQRVAERFLLRLNELDENQVKLLSESLPVNGHRPTIRSAFDLSEELQQRLRVALRRKLNLEGELAFTTSEEVVFGIELQAAGGELSWSVCEFLGELRDEMTRDLGL